MAQEKNNAVLGDGGANVRTAGPSGRLTTDHKLFGLEELRVRSEMFAELLSLFDTSTALVVVCDPDDRIIFWNRGAEEKYLWKKEDAVGKNWLELLKTSFSSGYDVVRRELTAGGRWEGELLQERKDSSPLRVAASVVARGDEQGNPVAFLIIGNDITEQKRLEREREAAELKLRESGEVMRGIIEHMPVMLVAVDNSGTVVAWNNECERVTGYSAAEMVSNPGALELLNPDPELRRRFLAKWAHPSGGFRDWEWPIERKGGGSRIISWSNISASFPICGWSTWAMGLDITARKIAEERLQAAHRQLSDMVECLPLAVLVINREKRVIAWNQAMERLTGVGKAEVIGRGDNCYSIPFYGKKQPMLVDMLGLTEREIHSSYGNVREERGSLLAERYNPRLLNEKGAFLLIKATPLYDKDGTMIGGIETVRDITEQKEYEAILKKDKDSFERLLKERTRQLLKAQAELADARHLSEIGMLAATVAHELRNPLAAIRMGAYNIKKKVELPAVMQHVETIERKVLESDQIIGNLLNYSRIKSPMFETVRLRELIDESVAAVKARFFDWRVEVKLRDECGDLPVRVDPLQVKEMLSNVLNNAYEALPEKSGSVSVHMKRGKNAFAIRISDSGVGITPENLRKITRPFFTTKTKGTGLGLAVCRQMVALHGGKIKFSSRQGEGTTVTISLPLKREENG